MDETDNCSECRLKACCAEALTCYTNDTCLGWLDCIVACPNDDSSCEEECRTEYAAGEDDAFRYLDCFTEAKENACAETCLAPAPENTSNNQTISSPPATSQGDETATADGGSPDAGASACQTCLDAACGPVLSACVDDAVCLYLEYMLVYCFDAEAAGTDTFVDCFGPTYSFVEAEYPESAALFDETEACLTDAQCPECE